MSLIRLMDTRSAEVLSALLALVIAGGMFTSPDNAIFLQTMKSVRLLPEWALVSAAAAAVSLFALFTSSARINATARFASGCMWGTIVLVFANVQQWLPLFWIALVMFAFDIYLVAVKGQSWTVRSSS